MARTPWEKWQEEKNRRKRVTSRIDNTYKKLGEYCTHPLNKRAMEKGWLVCLLCGKILNEDKDG